jgi:hypothetical protein
MPFTSLWEMRRLRPKRALFVGMSDQYKHLATNAKLRHIFKTEVAISLFFKSLDLMLIDLKSWLTDCEEMLQLN